ncbi:hypothetical protein K474DRAFT_358338 [Panus rudis PR-1116 ss-1]|nr:hypothetical protein K474DRAFT_358338 [Panus rudis PR-1116 ss-1]
MVMLIAWCVDLFRSSIVDTLNEGTTIVCDRYAFSGIAFSAAKVRPTSSSSQSSQSSQPTNPLTDNPPPPTTSTHPAPTPILPYEWCRSPDHHLPAPDLTFFLDISPTLASTRASYGSERYENTEMQERVREVFERMVDALYI